MIDSEAVRPASALGRDRDRELVRLVGRHGVLTVEQVMRATGVGRTATYRRVAVLIEAGLLERIDLLRSQPTLLHANREGLRYAGLAMPVARVSPGTVDHWLRCATVALDLGEHYGHDRVLTEREIPVAVPQQQSEIAAREAAFLCSDTKVGHYSWSWRI